MQQTEENQERDPHPFGKTRRRFLKEIAAVGTLGIPSLHAAAADQEKTRRVWVMSDAHAGRVEDGKDGAEWVAVACKDMVKTGLTIDYALLLGDLTQNGKQKELENLLAARKESGVATWHELAGNHEYSRGKAEFYTKLVRSIDPYNVIDGNIAWFFLSDEAPGVPGNLTGKTCEWLEAGLAKHADKITIVCSHQLVRDTIFQSNQSDRHIQPSERLAAIIAKSKIDLWMCGHEHHSPYSAKRIARVKDTTYINVASISHAYNTKSCQSFLLELKHGAREIIARRRCHDTAEFQPEFEVKIPLRSVIELGAA